MNCILRADTALYLKLNERFGLDPKYITHDFQYYFKVDTIKWSAMAFADLPANHKTTSLAAWSDLVLHAFEVKRMALGGISDSRDDLTKLLALTEANKNKDYDKIVAIAKKEFPGQRFS